MKVKLALYERHKVKEYWIVHSTDKVVMVFRSKQGTYTKPEVYADADEDVIEYDV